MRSFVLRCGLRMQNPITAVWRHLQMFGWKETLIWHSYQKAAGWQINPNICSPQVMTAQVSAYSFETNLNLWTPAKLSCQNFSILTICKWSWWAIQPGPAFKSAVTSWRLWEHLWMNIWHRWHLKLLKYTALIAFIYLFFSFWAHMSLQLLYSLY